jgi:beta-lactamase regulating signal transducer with metallopeptidase domain
MRQGRIAALLRMIPIFKLPLDLCLYDFSRWSYTNGVNPLLCEEGTRRLSIMCSWMNLATDWLFIPMTSGIQFTAPGNLTFTIADVIGHIIGPLHLKVFVALFIPLSAAFLTRRIFVYYRSIISLDSLAKSSQPTNRKTRNPFLSSHLKKWQLQILTSPIIVGSPFVAGLISSIVYIPESLSQNLSRKEYEAVLAHEMEHVRYKDSLVRLILDFIGTLFWWIPTKWLRNRIEEGQEVGCDLKCKNYGINPTDLASAICKSAKHSTTTPNHIFAHHLTKHTIFKRVDILLNQPSMRFKKIRVIFATLSLPIAFFMIFLGRFWTF